jgi:NADPH-dependent 7-cyano-7-deazaguanine reductase QueF
LALEFASICPLTGALDFGTLIIREKSRRLLLELKSLRDFLISLR